MEPEVRWNRASMLYGDVPERVPDEEKREVPMRDAWWADSEWAHPARDKLASCGAMTGISRHARIYQPEHVSLGRGCRIDDFVYLNAGAETEIGDRVHIACHCTLTGGGVLVLESYVGLATGVRVLTGTEDHHGESLTNPCIPEEFWHPKRGKVVLRKHALIYANVVIIPGVEIGEGAVVGSGCVVRKNLAPWRVYAGEQCRPVKARNPDRVLALEAHMVERYGF